MPATVHPWFALHIRSRHEKLASGVLRHKAYEVFLPLYKARRRWSDRFKIVEAPLFPGYLFCRFDPQRRLEILKTAGVVGVVSIAGTPAPVEEGEIDAIQAIVESGLAAEPWPFLRTGEWLQIEYGPLRGLQGILLSVKKGHRLIVSVTLLQRSVAVEMDHDWVRPVHTGFRAFAAASAG